MNKTFYFIFCIFFLLNACSTMEPQTMSSKNARTIPTWVNTRPQDPDYYIGIGTASKNNSNSESYMALAKKNALADLASEISIQIESRSILNTLQTGHDFSQQFTNQIKAENSIKLEGYEQMGTWENSDYYWIYYRLSKKAYEQWKIRQKEAAVSQARNQYLQAKKMIENKLYINALKLYIEALTSLESYLNETTLCEFNQLTKAKL